MPNIKPLVANSVAVISDAHMGAGNSILDDPTEMHRFRDFVIEHVGKSEVLVLLGDIFDLSLARYEETVPKVQSLLKIVASCADRLIYVPGNHDHHIWLLASERAEVMDVLPEVPHGFYPRTDRIYGSDALPFLAQLMGVPKIEICYPNVYVMPKDAPGLAYVLHHGHYVEDTFTIISDLYADLFNGKVPTLEELEELNAGWFEMLWYHLGQIGAGIGADGFVEAFYGKIEKQETRGIEDAIRRLYIRKLSTYVHGILDDLVKKHWYVPAWLARLAAKFLDRHAPGWLVSLVEGYGNRQVSEGTKRASSFRGTALDKELGEHCDEYCDQYLVKHHDFLNGHRIRTVFGHTHSSGIWPIENPRHFNSGGWIRGPKGEWPDARVLRIDARGTLETFAYGQGGVLAGKQSYP